MDINPSFQQIISIYINLLKISYSFSSTEMTKSIQLLNGIFAGEEDKNLYKFI